MSIKNECSIKNDEKVTLVRNAIEHRATWMGLQCAEAEKTGADWEAIARKAVRQTGGLHGGRIAENMEKKADMKAFAAAFLPELTKKLFEMEITELTDDRMKVEFHYCPLVSAWQKLGFEEQRMDTLCDIAMDGDRGIAAEIGFDFELGDTIAKGNETCKLCFTRK